MFDLSPWSSAIGGIASGLGSFFGGRSESSGASETNAKSIALAQDQMRFQERMSGTAYQRATADMRAAGVNPMLAYSQGGASSPAGSLPQLTNPNVGLGRGISGVGSSAKDAILNKAQLDLIKEQTEAAHAQGTNSYAQAALNSVNAQIAEGGTAAAKNRMTVDSGQFGVALEYMKRLGIDFNSAKSIVQMIASKRLPPTRTTVNGNTGVVHTTKYS